MSKIHIKYLFRDFGRYSTALFFRVTSRPEYIRTGKKSRGLQIEGPAIILMNHTSYFDGPNIIASFLRRRLNVLTYQKAFEKGRPLAFGLRHIGCIPVDKDGNDLQAILRCRAVLENGELLAVFPEGTINQGDPLKLQPFQIGAAMLALLTRVPVYPVYCSGNYRPFKKMFFFMGGPITDAQDRSLAVKRANAEQLTRIFEKRMQELVREASAYMNHNGRDEQYEKGD